MHKLEDEEPVNLMMCHVCAPETEVKHVVRTLIMPDGSKGKLNVWTCAACGNQRRMEKDTDKLLNREPLEVKKDSLTGEIRIGTDEEGIKIMNVEGTCAPGSELSKEVCEALGLEKKWRMIGMMLEYKIPLFETAKGKTYEDDIIDRATSKLYICKYDLIATPGNNMYKMKAWCVYMERSIGDKEFKAGCYINDEAINDIAIVKSCINDLNKALNKKFAN